VALEALREYRRAKHAMARRKRYNDASKQRKRDREQLEMQTRASTTGLRTRVCDSQVFF
jgi:hypothetical protein